jgi:internalin A
MPSITNTTKRQSSLVTAQHRIDECVRTNATDLNLSSLNLDALPESIGELTWLQSLILFNNNITRLPEWLGKLVELRELKVNSNPIEALPNSLSELGKLEILSIDGCSPTAAEKCTASAATLQHLAIASLSLKRLPTWVRRFTRLKKLYASKNQLTALPKWLESLPELEHLDLTGNRIRSIPGSLRRLPSLTLLRLSGNAELRLPAEILQSDDAHKILDYYFRTVTSGPRQPLNEFKLILVGRGGVGKTTLVHRMLTDGYRQFPRTPGVNITKWSVRIDGEDVRAHVWDFGGQEIMHGTHRFFMTERALYLILISGREGTEDHDAEYWLSLVRSFAGDAPVLILLHKCDDYRFELNRQLLRQKYGQDLHFIETDSQTGLGIRELRECVCALAKTLPGLKAAWPVEWRLIKEELPAVGKNWLTFEDFCAFCCERGSTALADQIALAQSLHDLGLMLSYRQDEALSAFGVLNPQWVTQGIYQMLNSKTIREAGGKFTVASFASELPPADYPKALHPYLLALMRKFRLCHPLDERGETHLIPELLTKREPDLAVEFPPGECLAFVYRYDTVLPEGLLPRFIVETYVHREPKHAWRTGVVLERDNCRALVRGDVQGRSITIRITGIGNGQRELLGIIRTYFERIHATYEKLPVTELVPLAPAYPQVTIPYQDLLAYEAAGDDEFKVVIDNRPLKFSVKKLLDGVDVPGTPRSQNASQSDLQRNERAQVPISVFISYSHKDAAFRDQLCGALVPYERIGDLSVWADPLIEPGQSWGREIFKKLDQATILILLLSADFLGSYYCMEKELARAMQRRDEGECEIVPLASHKGQTSCLILWFSQGIDGVGPEPR